MSPRIPIKAEFEMRKLASFNADRTHRYVLVRAWEPGLPIANIIGLNPSTADEELDDPTIRRCIGFARAWGCGALQMTNLFSFRATDPKEMLCALHPSGSPVNDNEILMAARSSAFVVAAWGAHGEHLGRGMEIYRLLRTWGVRPQCLGVTQRGQPRHPLYLRGDSPLTEWAA